MLSKADSLTYKAAQRVREGESLEETLSNHLTYGELESFNLSEINFTHGIDLFSKSDNISRIILMNDSATIKPTQDEVVRVITDREIIEALEASEKEYTIYYDDTEHENRYVTILYQW